MVDPDKFYSSRVLYNQLLNTSEDINISFLYTNPDSDKLGVLRTENLDYLVQEDGTDLEFNIKKDVVNGLSVFLLDGTNTAGLTGGKVTIPAIGTAKIGSIMSPIGTAKVNSNPKLTVGPNLDLLAAKRQLLKVGPSRNDGVGINLVDDSTITTLSALSGLMVMATIDQTGYFALSSDGGNNGALSQFTSGLSTLEPGMIAVRTADRGATLTNQPSAFPFKGSISNQSSDMVVVDKQFKIFSIAFKRHLQDLVLYNRTLDGIETKKIINTDIHLPSLPSSVRFGISYSGHMPMEIKNITVNGTILQ